MIFTVEYCFRLWACVEDPSYGENLVGRRTRHSSLQHLSYLLPLPIHHTHRQLRFCPRAGADCAMRHHRCCSRAGTETIELKKETFAVKWAKKPMSILDLLSIAPFYLIIVMQPAQGSGEGSPSVGASACPYRHAGVVVCVCELVVVVVVFLLTVTLCACRCFG